LFVVYTVKFDLLEIGWGRLRHKVCGL